MVLMKSKKIFACGLWICFGKAIQPEADRYFFDRVTNCKIY